MKRRQVIILSILFILILILTSMRFLVPLTGHESRIDNNNLNLSNILSNQDEIIRSIRDGLRSHSARIQIKFSYDKPDIGGSGLRELKELCAYWIEEALKETDNPAEGDYIRYQYGGYRLVCRRGERDSISGKYIYTAEIIPEYYIYYTREEEVTAKLTELFDNFAFTDGTTDYEKIRVIYDYICRNVKYDRVHKKNARYHVKSTAYAALILRNATCQGYCAALYRMLRQAGVSCRIVTGTATARNSAQPEFHAWNLVKLNNLWYYLDATWDSENAESEEYSCFLRGQNDFPAHIIGAEFDNPAFWTEYPVAETGFQYYHS